MKRSDLMLTLIRAGACYPGIDWALKATATEDEVDLEDVMMSDEKENKPDPYEALRELSEEDRIAIYKCAMTRSDEIIHDLDKEKKP